MPGTVGLPGGMNVARDVDAGATLIIYTYQLLLYHYLKYAIVIGPTRVT